MNTIANILPTIFMILMAGLVVYVISKIIKK
ncbi:Uncharacterised protein [Peptoniphilus indolicus]|uniref:Uncharacterized protein n=1 Tax=Peptoniphilus indolicus TaxID=33030 RepID=A0A379DAM5_9FIRM|nr:Uncharacterised protein [Peptoniphilus indolicus]